MSTENIHQVIFNRVWEHAKDMTQPATKLFEGRNKPACAYRGDTGNCLIGALIKDENYNTDLEGKGAGVYIVMVALAKSGVISTVNDDDAEFLNKLQFCHDDLLDYEEYSIKPFNEVLMDSLRKFAENRNLTIPEGEV